MTGPYRLTFNKPAVAQLLQTDSGETADGLKVRIQDNAAQFLPVRSSDEGDVLKLTDRSRGGVEAAVEGSMAADLAEALKNEHGPFHTLRRVGGGWVEATPYGKAEAPSKFTPHVRVWDSDFVARPKPSKSKRSKTTRTAAATPVPAPRLDIADMFEQLREAKDTLERHGTGRRGQPPREVRAARDALGAFERYALDFLPEVSEAHALLHGVIARADTKRKRKPEAVEMISAAEAPTTAAKARRKPRKATGQRRPAKAQAGAIAATA